MAGKNDEEKAVSKKVTETLALFRWNFSFAEI